MRLFVCGAYPIGPLGRTSRWDEPPIIVDDIHARERPDSFVDSLGVPVFQAHSQPLLEAHTPEWRFWEVVHMFRALENDYRPRVERLQHKI